MSTLAPPEIHFVASFLTELIPPSHDSRVVRSALVGRLTARFVPQHWHLKQPERGSGYRAISFDPSRQDGYLDPVLAILAELLALSSRQLRRIISLSPSLANASGWTIWCDPGCVSMRAQASGGELRELWGHLPAHLTHLRLCSATSPTHIPRSPPTQSSSPTPNKSRAIPILAPSTAARLAGVSGLAVIPPTPAAPERRLVKANAEEEDEHDLALAEHLARPFSLAPQRPSAEEDPFLRPSSRTSCASSSSDDSDHSGFSGSSSSTATSVAPVVVVVAQKAAARPHVPVCSGLAQPQAGFIRHHSTSSLPFVTMGLASPAGLMPAVPLQGGSRAASPAFSNASRRRHAPSASVSSLGGGRGLLVLKEGPGTVTEHSGGKVGVMGGGVLLGLPKDRDAAGGVSTTGPKRVVNRRSRTTTGSGNF